MTTKIEVINPVLRCKDEEDIFFQRLSEVPGIRNLTQQDSVIHLSLSSGQFHTAKDSLNTICDMWHTTFRLIEE